MKILIVASVHHPAELARERAALPPGAPDPLFPSSMSQHFWVKALRAQGHEVFLFPRSEGVLPGMGRISEQWIVRGLSQRMPTLNPDYQLRNRRLLDMARRLRPDVLWLEGDNEVIYPQTLARLKAETGALLLYTTGDSPIVFSHANERAAGRLYDLVSVNDFYHGIQWRELGAKHMITLPNSACDPAFHHPYAFEPGEREQLVCDVAFVGTLAPANLYSERVQALEALRDFDLGIWSVHGVPESLRPYVRGRALGQDMLRILSAAKIAINVHGDFMRYGGNLRLFEAAAVGVCQIADDLPGVHEWFTPGETILTYTSLDDLCAKVAHYLDHPAERERISALAQTHVYAHHTYDQRAAALMQMIADIRAS